MAWRAARRVVAVRAHVLRGVQPDLGWRALNDRIARFIEAVTTHFGAPTDTWRDVALRAGPPPAPVPETERRQRIELINRHIAAEGFAPKDFFLTQTPPEKVDELARRKNRERRRRPIARRLARWGLTAPEVATHSVPR